MSLDTYLKNYFVDKATFATLSGISVRRLELLIAASALPRATYVCNGKSIASAVFGAIAVDEPLEGEFFRPECVRWAKIADKAASGSEQAAVLAVLLAEFTASLQGFGYPDDVIEAKIRNYLPSFFDGTFGLCVADPSTGAGIVRKEILQQTLSEVTEDGSCPLPAGYAKEDILTLIDNYAKSAMPFSPVEYSRSSRKRLVDDLRPLVT